MSCGHNGLNFYIVTSPLVTKSQGGAGIGNSKGNARNTGHVFQRWWLLSSHDILFSAFSVLCSVSVQRRPEDAIGNTTQRKSMPSEMSMGVFYLCVFSVLCRRREGRRELNQRKREITAGRKSLQSAAFCLSTGRQVVSAAELLQTWFCSLSLL